MTPERWRQIDSLVDLALEQEPSQRSAFLATACAGDEALRQDVEALLTAHERAGSFLAEPASVGAIKTAEAEVSTLVGHEIGPYQILSALGQGGMGEVYLARDIRLGRRIALKLLPSQFTSDRDRLSRFQREARSAASLNHPNIVTIHEIAEQNGKFFIVTEFIEGRTLRQHMAGGPLPVREILDVAIQVASALGAAHTAGIVHRDVKPENIMLRRDGLAKVLDFGLAKLSERNETVGEAQNDKIQWSETVAGLLMGTARYMSPEQARGLKLDIRTDLFSLGVVLYEMVTGQLPFGSETATDVIVAIVEKEPLPPSQLARLPAELERIIFRSLSKNLEARYQKASELERDLRRLRRRLEVEEDAGRVESKDQPEVSAGRIDGLLGKTQELPVRALPSKKLRSLLWIALLVLASTVCSLLLVIWLRSAVPAPTVLNTVQITSDRRPKLYSLLTDGARVYFTENVGGRWTPAYVSTSGGEVFPISMSLPSASVLDISPHGSELLVASWSGLGVPGPLWILPMVGGSARRLADLEAWEATWSPNGEKLAYIKENDLYLANSDGTEPRKLLTMPGHPFFIRWAPDGRRLTVSVSDDPHTEFNQLWEIDADGSNLHPRFPDWNNPPASADCAGRWTPDGRYFLFDSYRGGGDNVWAVREDEGFLKRPSREPVRLTSGPMETGKPLPSKDGKRVFFLGRAGSMVDQLMRYDSKSGEWAPYLSGISAEQLDFSKDGQWITYVSFPEANLIRSRMDGSQRLQLTSAPLKASKPRWSPDGKRIVFMAKTPERPWKIWMVSADGDTAQPLFSGGDALSGKALSSGDMQGTSQAEERDPDWSPDGNSVVFYRRPKPAEEAASLMPIYILDLETRTVRRVAGSGHRLYPRWSPDGRYLAATANFKTVTLFDFKTQQWADLAQGEPYYPVWSRDGQALYFIDWTQNDEKRGYYRIEIRTRRLERIIDLTQPVESGTDGGWVGLAPDDSPIVLFTSRAEGPREVYAFDWVAP
ncbi:MAG: protein kinase [Acidobacteriota bacterium]